jgi:hypothetical protein
VKINKHFREGVFVVVNLVFNMEQKVINVHLTNLRKHFLNPTLNSS